MKILIINPNSDEEMTKVIERNARNFAKGEYEVDCITNETAPAFVTTYNDIAETMPGLKKIIEEKEKYYDAFVIACHSDPNLDLLKELCDKPVVGVGEASLKIASMLGHKFSIIMASDKGIPNKELLVRKYGLISSLASFAVANNGEGFNWQDQDNLILAAKKAIDEDMSEVIVLGCAGMGHVAGRMQEILHVPVLDGVTCALIIAVGLVKAGLSTSKVRRFKSLSK
ncbi:aspartate/glutamate racemase family protein [Paratissierella segnis]|jgi:allantoin racemase|uniref:Asp/Glu/hydantoin racemase n=1 Tax=Paratissierella segnis TaxID=2763679 RepID=A0A926EZ45_9FIRM|nr:aspartate/glutamate racemase family protein [Paratissierella segnis]MBC8588939.1 Asp/Glu/hydantoin racemase [Paratissierella segnis]